MSISVETQELPRPVTDFPELRNYVTPYVSGEPEAVVIWEPQSFNGLIFGICMKGSGVINVNDCDFSLRAGQILTILPNQVFRTVSRSMDCFVEILFCSVDFVSPLPFKNDYNLILEIGKEPCIEAPEDTIHDMLDLHALIVKNHNDTTKPNRSRVVIHLVQALLVEVGTLYTGRNKCRHVEISSRQEELTQKFMHQLVLYGNKKRSVEFYADRLCVTAKHLTTTIKKVTDHSMLEWIFNFVIMEAKRLLKSSDMTILEISEELDFPNPSFFSHFFREHAGVTPLHYRNYGF